MEFRKKHKGYFLCADILGFRQIVENELHIRLNNRLEKWVEAVLGLSEEYALTCVKHFSDTIFVKTESSCNGLSRMLEFSRSLLEKGIEHSFPIRGGIAHGPVVWDKKKTFGQAVIDAHQIEQESDWIGIACSRDCCHTEPLTSWDRLVTYPVPKKDGQVKELSVVAWCVPPVSKLICSTTSGKNKSYDHTKVVNTWLFGKYLKHGKQNKYDPRLFQYESILHFLDDFKVL